MSAEGTVGGPPARSQRRPDWRFGFSLKLLPPLLNDANEVFDTCLFIFVNETHDATFKKKLAKSVRRECRADGAQELTPLSCPGWSLSASVFKRNLVENCRPSALSCLLPRGNQIRVSLRYLDKARLGFLGACRWHLRNQDVGLGPVETAIG